MLTGIITIIVLFILIKVFSKSKKKETIKNYKTETTIINELNDSDSVYSKGFNNEEFLQLKAKKFPSKYLYPIKDLEDTSHFFYGKKVVITGDFESFPFREELARLVWETGADIDTAVGKRTNIAIVGSSDVGPSKMEKIIQQGIRIVREDELNTYFPNSTMNKFKKKQNEKTKTTFQITENENGALSEAIDAIVKAEEEEEAKNSESLKNKRESEQ